MGRMGFSMLPYPRLIVAFTMLGYPLKWYLSHMIMRKGTGVSHHEHVQWMMYWLILAVWMFLESNFFWFLTDYLPFFLELKVIFFVWLQHAEYQGALYIWYARVAKEFNKIDAKVGPIVEKIKGVKTEVKAKVEELKPPDHCLTIKNIRIDGGHIKRRPGIMGGAGMVDIPDPYVFFKISTGVMSSVTARTTTKTNDSKPDWSDETHSLAGLGTDPCTLKCEVTLLDADPVKDDELLQFTWDLGECKADGGSITKRVQTHLLDSNTDLSFDYSTSGFGN